MVKPDFKYDTVLDRVLADGGIGTEINESLKSLVDVQKDNRDELRKINTKLDTANNTLDTIKQTQDTMKDTQDTMQQTQNDMDQTLDDVDQTLTNMSNKQDEIKNTLDAIEENTEPQQLDTPTGLADDSIGETSISLSWDGVNNAESYVVKRDGNEIDTVNNTSFNDDGLDPNTQYEYTVTAQADGFKSSNPTDVITITTNEESQN